jgi:hypothetical protein
LINFCLVLLLGDGDNVLFFCVKSLAVPLLLIAAAGHRMRGWPDSMSSLRWPAAGRATFGSTSAPA